MIGTGMSLDMILMIISHKHGKFILNTYYGRIKTLVKRVTYQAILS